MKSKKKSSSKCEEKLLKIFKSISEKDKRKFLAKLKKKGKVEKGSKTKELDSFSSSNSNSSSTSSSIPSSSSSSEISNQSIDYGEKRKCLHKSSKNKKDKENYKTKFKGEVEDISESDDEIGEKFPKFQKDNYKGYDFYYKNPLRKFNFNSFLKIPSH